MSIELSSVAEAQVRVLAAKTGRDVRVLVEEAIQQYAESIAITDVEPGDVANAQTALLPELPDIAAWKADRA